MPSPSRERPTSQQPTSQQPTAQPDPAAPAPTPLVRRWWFWASLGAVVLVVAAFVGPWVYATYIAEPAPAPFLSLSTTSSGAATPATPSGTAPAASGAASPTKTSGEATLPQGTWSVGAGSQAGYRVDEVLNGQNVTVAGRTGAVSGSVTMTDTQVTAGTVTVDLTGVRTDNASRDAQFNSTVMQTGTWPTAVFTLTEPFGVQATGGTATLAGELTLRDQTHPVSAQVQYSGSVPDGVTVVGQIPATFADWGIEAPSLGFVTVEKSGLIEFRLHLTHQ